MKYLSHFIISAGFLVLLAACGSNNNNNATAGTCQAGYVAQVNGSQTSCCPTNGTVGQCYALNTNGAVCQPGYINNGSQCCPQNGTAGQCYTVAATPNQCPVATPYNPAYPNQQYNPYYNNGAYPQNCGTQPGYPGGYYPQQPYPYYPYSQPYGMQPYNSGYYMGYPSMPYGAGFSFSAGGGW